MILQFNPFMFIYLAAVAIGIFLLSLTRKLPEAPGNRPLQALIIGAVIWSAGYVIEILSADLQINFVATLIEYLGILIIPTALLLFILSYTGREQYLGRRSLSFLAVIPSLTFIAIITNPLHLLYYTSVTPFAIGDLTLFIFHYGPLFYIGYGYIILLIIFTLSLLFITWMDYPAFYRPQISLLILATILPVLTSSVYVAKLGPVPGLQITPVILILVGGILVFASVRYHLFTILPRTQCKIPDYLNDGILIVDGAGTVVYLNPAAEEYLSITSAQALGRNCTDIIPVLPVEGEIREMTRPEGGILEIQRLILRETGAPDQMVILHDISPRRYAEVGLRNANRQLSLLSSVTRHDILNQITVVQGCIELARDRSMDSELLHYLNMMNLATDRIRSEIEFTRVYQDLGTQEPQWQNIASIIKPLTGVEFSFDCGEYAVYADLMLPKVFENLFDNARRHGERVTTIRINSEEISGTLRITIEDDGVGIPNDEKEKIFERGHGKNTGLGLFLVREILSITDITIIEDGTVGVGARFLITVPEGGFKQIRSETGTPICHQISSG